MNCYLVVCRVEETIAKSSENNEPDINQLSFTELRDKLLALDPLDTDHVIKINQAEAEFWRKSEGYRVGWSDEILGFDCGGQQWVSENCFPAGSLGKPNMKDLEFMEELQKLIQSKGIPAPAPIEQRWTARSRSLMSPASSSIEDDIFSWVNLISNASSFLLKEIEFHALFSSLFKNRSFQIIRDFNSLLEFVGLIVYSIDRECALPSI